jgi:hypothetical protein
MRPHEAGCNQKRRAVCLASGIRLSKTLNRFGRHAAIGVVVVGNIR